MKKIMRFVIAFFLIAIFTGCTGRPIRLETVNQKINKADYDFTRGKKILASAGGFQLFLFIPISVNKRHDRALQALKRKAYYDYITDYSIKESWTYWLVGTVYTTTIEATAYPLK
jgi:hypothetical protein